MEQIPESPFDWPKRKKWMVTLTTCYITMIVGINATSITAAAVPINHRFGVSDATFPNSVWPVTAWNTGAAIAPMIVVSIMEEFGMRTGYIICYVLFILFVIPQAVAPNFATLIVCRFIAGCCGGVLQDVMDGIIADIWSGPGQRSLPVTIYVFALYAGVISGPVIGGAIISTLYWRWIFYVQLILYGLSLPIVCVGLKETRAFVIAEKRQEKLLSVERRPASASQSLMSFVRVAVILPSYLLVTEPVVFFFTLLSSLSYGLVFMGTQSVPQVYSFLYGFPEYQSGLVQAALLIGASIGFVITLFQNSLYIKRAGKTTLPPQSLESSLAEVRLYYTIPGSIFGLMGGLLFYGWSSYPRVHWAVPSLGLILIGSGAMVVMQGCMMYITDSYEKYAASASAAVCFGENIFAAFLPLAVMSMYRTLGFQWASSLLGFIALALSIAPMVLVWKGREIRKRSPYMRKAAYG